MRGTSVAAVRFRVASRTGQSGVVHLPQFTPTFESNLRLGSGQSCNVAGLDFGATAVLAMHLSAGESSVAGQDGPERRFSLVFIVDGEMLLVEDSGESKMRAGRGDVWTFGGSLNFRILVAADTQLVAVTLPKQVLEEFSLTGDVGLGALDSHSSLLTPALGFLREIALQDGDVPSMTGHLMEKLVHEMVGGIMLESRGTRHSRGSYKGFYDQAMDCIAASARDRSFTPASLAEALSLSLRQLQREFKRHNTSIATVILQRRIELAARKLKDPTLKVMPLDEIAKHSGFSSAVHLRRAFKDAKLGSPTQIRNGASDARTP